MTEAQLKALLSTLGWQPNPDLKDIWTEGERGKHACYWEHISFPKQYVLVVSEVMRDFERRCAETVQDLGRIYNAPSHTLLLADWLRQKHG